MPAKISVNFPDRMVVVDGVGRAFDWVAVSPTVGRQ